MIDKIVNLLVGELGQYVRNQYGVPEDPVVCANLVDIDGSVSVPGENKLVVSLINVEHETVIPRTMRETPGGEHGILASPSPLYFNLVILLAAYFQKTSYLEALKYLSAGMAFFQRRPVFSNENAAAMNGLVEKITVENMNLSLNELGNLWGQLGGKYLPSVVYKIRRIPFDGDYPVMSSKRIVNEQAEVVSR